MNESSEEQAAKAESARIENATARAKQRAIGTDPPASALARGCGAAVLLSGVWLVGTVPTYALEEATRGTALRQAGFGIVLILLGVRLAMVRARAWSGALSAAVAALSLVSLAIWWPPSTWVWVAGLLGGGVALVAGAGAAFEARRAATGGAPQPRSRP